MSEKIENQILLGIIIDSVASELADKLPKELINGDTDLFDAGLDSVGYVGLVLRIEQALGRSISMILPTKRLTVNVLVEIVGAAILEA